MEKVIVLFSLLFAVLLTTTVAAQDLNKGIEAHDRGDFATALYEFRPLAEQGVADAQFNLGVMYTFGFGVPQDYAEAMKWYRLAAQQGQASAQNNLALMYENGYGVPQDYAKAVKWYRLAAEQGVVQAQFNLGVAYAKGQGIPPDFVQAHKWFNLAALHGDGSAAHILNYVTQQMTPDQSAEAERFALEWLNKHRN